MSPLYLPIKKKSVQPPKSTASQADCQHNTENDTPQSKQDALMTQMNGTKRFEDLQSVPLTSVDYPSASCSVMSSAPLTNGATPGFMAPPPARLPPPIAPKAEWTTPEQSRDQSWNCAQDRSCGPWASEREAWGGGKGHAEGQQMWGPNRDRGGPGPQGGSAGGPGPGGGPEGRPGGGPEGGWSTGRDWCQGPGREEGWREQTWSNSTPVSNNGSNTVAPSAAHPSTDPKPTAVPVKKELPVYPPGSEEEQWQLQIMAKGRVTCPKCKSVSRKTVEGLKKHMDNCRLEPFSCPHCGKQLKSSTGMKYHIMADHSLLPSSDAKDLDDRAVKEKLRKILKRLGKLKCSQQGCSAAFTSIMGYFYHMRKCGKEQSELEKMALSCVHCGKSYRSKAGLEYHLRTEHAPVTVKTEAEEVQAPPLGEQTPERTACGRVQRASAQVANLQLAHIAHNELPKDWSKRKFQSDLVPDDKKLKYSRPGLPAFSQEVLRKWKNEVKLHRKVHCPNKGCGSVYTSVSGLKAHLGLCTKGEFEAGKYRCLICNKEFNSESGVKYHINSVHSQDWFVTNKKACKKFEKLLKTQPKDFPPISDPRLSQDFLQQQQQQQQHQQQQHFQHYPPPPHHQHHHHHVPPPHQLQPPPQPLHHLQPQKHLLYPENQPLPPHPDPRMHQQQPPVHYTPLQPVWVERRAEKHQQDVRNMNRTRDGGGAERSGFEFEGVRGDNGSREMEEEMQRQMWDQKRQMLESVDVVKRQEST